MKKLYKIEEGKMLCGVCTGVAEYLRVDVNVVRLVTIVASCCGGIGLVAYIAGAVMLPFKDEVSSDDITKE